MAAALRTFSRALQVGQTIENGSTVCLRPWAYFFLRYREAYASRSPSSASGTPAGTRRMRAGRSESTCFPVPAGASRRASWRRRGS